MNFAAGQWWVLWIVGLAMVIWLWALLNRRLDRLGKWVSPMQWPSLLVGWTPGERKTTILYAGAGIFFLVLAMMQPQFGTETQTVTRKGQDIMFVLDVSRSMLAQDVEPSRLGLAKREMLGLLDRLKGDRVGLIAFAGEAFTVCPLTLDYGAMSLFVETADVNSVPVPGSNLGMALKAANKALRAKNQKFKAVILLTDGEHFDGDVAAEIKQAKSQGIRIYTVGIGSEAGDPIPVLNEKGAVSGYKKDAEGKLILSKLDKESLLDIADGTQGFYIQADVSKDRMTQIYEDISRQEKQTLEESLETRYKDRYQLPLLAALGFFMMAWFRRVR